jgi:hypothetical protein
LTEESGDDDYKDLNPLLSEQKIAIDTIQGGAGSSGAGAVVEGIEEQFLNCSRSGKSFGYEFQQVGYHFGQH